jgi:hypothetical protein
MTPKRFARTLEEAFGPGHRGGIYEAPSEFGLVDKIITGVCGVILFGLFIAIVKGWI